MIDNEEWKQFVIYETYVGLIKDGFERLDLKKEQAGRPIKYSSNIGEINSLAAAMLLSANFICSNDYDIREVIQDENLSISPDEDSTPELIIQDTIEDICYLSVKRGVTSKKEVRQFFKFVYNQDIESKRQQKVARLNDRLEEI